MAHFFETELPLGFGKDVNLRVEFDYVKGCPPRFSHIDGGDPGWSPEVQIVHVWMNRGGDWTEINDPFIRSVIEDDDELYSMICDHMERGE